MQNVASGSEKAQNTLHSPSADKGRTKHFWALYTAVSSKKRAQS